jgi:hypothetical protein
MCWDRFNHLVGLDIGTRTSAHGLLANLCLGRVAWHLWLFRQMRLAEAKDGDEGLVDAPLLFWGTLPASSPSRAASTAPTCSTRTRVVSPRRSISGRNDAGLALRDVGATNTAERGRSSLA